MQTVGTREGRGARTPHASTIGAKARSTIALGALALASLVTLAACGGGDGTTGVTTTTTLDTTAISASGTKIQAIVSQPLLATILTEGPSQSISLQRISRAPRLLPHVLTSAARLVPNARLTLETTPGTLAPHATSGAPVAVIPDSLLGKSLIPDALGNYHVSSSAAAGPSNGVRFVVSPLGSAQVLGYADLTERLNGATDSLMLDVKTTTGAILLHDVESTTTTANGETDGYAGYATDSTDRIDYAVTTQTVGSRTVSITTVSAPSATLSVADTSIVAGMLSSDVNVTRIVLGTTNLRFTTGATANATAGGYVASDTTNLAANGAPFARIVVPANGSPIVSGPNGGSLSSGDQQALAATESVLYGASLVMEAAPTVVYWLYAVTGV